MAGKILTYFSSLSPESILVDVVVCYTSDRNVRLWLVQIA